jgi:AhpD family alkylhydroperoxidase
MNKIEEIKKRRQEAHRQLLDVKSKVYEAFLKLEAATFAEGALPRKTKELIAIGISVVSNCESCMEWHITQAARSGASRQEVLEAVEVGIEMAGGLATVAARFALEVMDVVFGTNEQKGQP